MRIFVLLIVAMMLLQIAHAQYIINQTTLQSPASFNISGQGAAQTFQTTQATGSGGNGHFRMNYGENRSRWAIGMNTEETGAGNDGSNFSLYAYSDTDFLGEYLSILRSNGYMGLGIRYPQAKLHLAASAAANSGLRFGVAHDAGNIQVPVNASPGGYNIDFYTWRDIHPEQIGARMRAERINVYFSNNALVQGMDFVFHTSDGLLPESLTERMRIRYNGNVGIGTASPDEKLAVNGTVRALKVKVTQTGWADFVFAQDYKLPPLMEVERFIRENRHLPDMPSEKEVAENGLDVGEMNKKLLQKVEELTLYIIQQEKEMGEMRRRLEIVENKKDKNANL